MRSLLAIALSCAAAAATAAATATTANAWDRPAGGDSASGSPEVIFTFDDGPHEVYTKRILDTLAEHDIKAVFFWVGQRVTAGGKLEARRALVARAIAEGHIIANHTVTHINLCQGPAKDAADEIDSNARIYAQLTGMPVSFFRAPYGADCRRLREMLAARNLEHLHWDIDPQEWKTHSTADTVAYVVGRLRHLEERAIILLHDTQYTTARALPQILAWIDRENSRRRKRGRPEIRIVSATALAGESVDAGARAYVRATGTRLGAGLRAALASVMPW